MITLRAIDDGSRCMVTFTLPDGFEVERAGVVGDFDEASWNPEGFPMHQDADGRWRVTLELNAGRSHEFRYLINGCTWINDETCPTIPNPFGSRNNVLNLEATIMTDVRSSVEVARRGEQSTGPG